jgi:hypothetical protein
MRWARDAIHHSGKMLRKTYEHVRTFARHTDHAIGVGRQIHHALSPLLDTYVGKRHRKPVEDALQSYNTLRSEVLRHDDNAHSALAAVRRLPNLGL